MCCNSPNLSSEQNTAKNLAVAVIVFGVFTLLGFGIPPYLGAIGGLFAIIGGSLITCCGSKTTSDGRGMHIAAVVLCTFAMIMHIAGVGLWLNFWFGFVNYGSFGSYGSYGTTSYSSSTSSSSSSVRRLAAATGYSACLNQCQLDGYCGSPICANFNDAYPYQCGYPTYKTANCYTLDMANLALGGTSPDWSIYSSDGGINAPSSSDGSSDNSAATNAALRAATANIANAVGTGLVAILIWPSIVLSGIAFILEFAFMIIGIKAINKIGSTSPSLAITGGGGKMTQLGATAALPVAVVVNPTAVAVQVKTNASAI